MKVMTPSCPPCYNIKPSSLYDILCLFTQRTPSVYHCKATFGNVRLCLKLIRSFQLELFLTGQLTRKTFLLIFNRITMSKVDWLHIAVCPLIKVITCGKCYCITIYLERTCPGLDLIANIWQYF